MFVIGKLTKDSILFIDVLPEDETEAPRTGHQIGDPPGFARIHDPGHERSLLAVHKHHNLKEFEDSLHIGDFNALAIFQFFHHPVEDV